MMFVRKRITPSLLVIAAAILLMIIPGAEPVHADDKNISTVYINCDQENWYIMPDKNGNDNTYRLNNHISLSGEGIASVGYGNLTSFESDGHLWGVNNGAIAPEKMYYMAFRMSAEDGYAWSDDVLAASDPVPVTDDLGLRVYFNGSRYTDAYIKEYLGDTYFYVLVFNDISAAKVSLSKNRLIYTGKKQVPSVKKAVLKGTALTSKNYSISYHDRSNQVVSPVEPGNYYVRLTGKGIYGGQVHVPFTIIRSNPMTVSVKAVKIKYNKLKKKAQTIKPGKAITVSLAKGKVTFKLNSAKKGKKTIKLSKAKKYFKITPDNGTIKVKKKLGKGTYTLKITITASGTKDYASASKVVTVKIKIK